MAKLVTNKGTVEEKRKGLRGIDNHNTDSVGESLYKLANVFCDINITE